MIGSCRSGRQKRKSPALGRARKRGFELSFWLLALILTPLAALGGSLSAGSTALVLPRYAARLEVNGNDGAGSDDQCPRICIPCAFGGYQRHA